MLTIASRGFTMGRSPLQSAPVRRRLPPIAVFLLSLFAFSSPVCSLLVGSAAADLREVPLTPRAAVEPELLHFGDIELHVTVDLEFRVENQGDPGSLIEITELGLLFGDGYYLLVDEPWKFGAAMNMCFMPMRDTPRSLKLLSHPEASEQQLLPDERTVLMFADNVRGVGDNIEKYSTTDIQDQALLNGVGNVVWFDYLPPEAEKEALVALYPVLSGEEADLLVKLGNLLRQAWDKGKLEVSWSMRSYQSMLDKYLITGNIGAAFSSTLGLDALSNDEQVSMVRQFWQDVGLADVVGKLT